MSKQDNGDRVWDIIEKVGVCMLTTQAAGRLRSRPIEARPERKAGLIFAVTDIHSAKQDEIEAVPDIGLVFIDAKARAYLSITARARACATSPRSRNLEKERRSVGAGRTERSECVPVADRASDRRLVGWTVERLGENRKVTVAL